MATIPTLNESIERMKQEILDDIKAGRVPADCPSFSALHDYVDANEYGGFCEDGIMTAMIEHFGGRDENEGMPDKMMEYLNDAQNTIDLWLKEGSITQGMASSSPANISIMSKIEIIEGTLEAAGGYRINGKPFVGDEHEALVGEAKQMAYATGRNIEEVLAQIIPGDLIMKKGDVVKFKEEKDPGDAACRMVLVEDPDGGRVLVRHLVDMEMQPTSIYLTKDLQLCSLLGNE